MAAAFLKILFVVATAGVIYAAVSEYFSPYRSCLRDGWPEKLCLSER